MDPTLSVVVCTRGRGEAAYPAVASLLAMRPQALEILVVDQGGDGALAARLAPGPIRYLPQRETGVSRARNLALAETRGGIVAFTDDDCVVPPDFVARNLRAFADYPSAGIVFGNVLPAPHDPRLGIIPGVVKAEPFLATRLVDQVGLGGMGACMALRRDVLPSLVGFDPDLGSGGRYHAAEEVDLTLRALALGIPVLETPEVWVTHHGFRCHADAVPLVWRYLFGTGAAYAKQARRHPLAMARVFARVALRFARGATGVDYGSSPRIPRLRAFAKGVGAGLRHGVDPATGLFLPIA